MSHQHLAKVTKFVTDILPIFFVVYDHNFIMTIPCELQQFYNAGFLNPYSERESSKAITSACQSRMRHCLLPNIYDSLEWQRG
jgi:hypothetical protein